jgi:hypothetical protein
VLGLAAQAVVPAVPPAAEDGAGAAMILALAAAHMPAKLPPNWPGRAIIIVVIFVFLWWLTGLLGIRKG